MRIAHLITAHSAPEQLMRLVSRLQHPDSDFFIYIDKKADIEPFLILKDIPNLHFIKHRIKIYWGEYSQVQSTLIGFKEIIAAGKEYAFINFISGSDYPLQPPVKFHSFLLDNLEVAFMEFYDIKTEWQEAISRINTYHLGHYRIKGIYTFQRILNSLAPDRKLPFGMQAVGRSSWFTLPVSCVKYILKFIMENPVVERYFKTVWGCDEIIFQTILYNSPFKKMMRNDNLRYIDWSEGGVNPKILTMKDKDKLIKSDKFFGRKFNDTVDKEILDFIDKEKLKIQH